MEVVKLFFLQNISNRKRVKLTFWFVLEGAEPRPDPPYNKKKDLYRCPEQTLLRGGRSPPQLVTFPFLMSIEHLKCNSFKSLCCGLSLRHFKKGLFWRHGGGGSGLGSVPSGANWSVNLTLFLY